jgi:hypothetical protein
MAEYDEFAEAPQDDSILCALLKRQTQLQQEVARLEEQLEAAKNALRKCSEEEFPAAMIEAGLQLYRTTDGIEVELQHKIHAAVPHPGSDKHDPAQWETAVSYLEEHAPAVIKRDLILSFGLRQEAAAKQCAQLLFEAGYRPTNKINIPWQTLSSVVKQWLKQGKDFPQDILGVKDVTKTVIKLPEE